MKKLISVLFALLMVFSLVACGGNNGNGGSDISETPASEFEYRYDAAIGGIVITKYTGTSIRVRIPTKIEGELLKAIGQPADAYNEYKGTFTDSGVKDVYIPDGVTEIRDDTFLACKGLTNITIPNSVERIGVRAFKGCTGLTSVTIPNGVSKIGMGAFSGCTGLTVTYNGKSYSYSDNELKDLYDVINGGQ